jgi:hypothetical protein
MFKKCLAVFSLSLMLSCSGSTLPFNVILYHPGARTPAPGIPPEAWNFCYDQIHDQIDKLRVKDKLGPKKTMCLHTMLMESCEDFIYANGMMRQFGRGFDGDYQEFLEWMSEYREDCLPVWDEEMEAIRRAFVDALHADRSLCP